MIAQPNGAYVRGPRLTSSIERRTPPLMSLSAVQDDLAAALSVIDSLLKHCAIYQIGGSPVTQGEQLLAQHLVRQLAYDGDEDGRS